MSKGNPEESAGAGILPAAVLTSAFLKGAEIWMNAHGEVLSAMEVVMSDWVIRRQQALDTWSRSLKKMCQCRDPVEFVQTQQDWLCDTIRLTASDIRALAGDSAILTRQPIARVDITADRAADDNLKTRKGRPETGGSQPADRLAAE